MVSRSPQSGVVLIEVIIAGIVFLTLLGWAFTGSSGQLRHVGDSFERTRATALAAGRLEALRADDVPLETGRSTFGISAAAAGGLADLRGEQRVRRLEPGLFEVWVTVDWQAPGSSRRREVILTTWIERGGDR